MWWSWIKGKCITTKQHQPGQLLSQMMIMWWSCDYHVMIMWWSCDLQPGELLSSVNCPSWRSLQSSVCRPCNRLCSQDQSQFLPSGPVGVWVGVKWRVWGCEGCKYRECAKCVNFVRVWGCEWCKFCECGVGVKIKPYVGFWSGRMGPQLEWNGDRPWKTSGWRWRRHRWSRPRPLLLSWNNWRNLQLSPAPTCPSTPSCRTLRDYIIIT